MTDERVCSLQDICRLIKRHAKTFLSLSLIASLGMVFLFSLRDSKYKVESSFFEASEYKISKDSLRNFMGSFDLIETSPRAAAFIKSQEVMKGLVERLGLLFSVEEESFFKKTLSRLACHVRADLGKRCADPDDFIFENGRFDGENSTSYELCFHSSSDFSVFNPKKIKLASGCIGKEVRFADANEIVEFTLLKTPQDLQIGKRYQIRVDPWFLKIKHLVNDLKISSDKSASCIYHLCFYHNNRRTAVRVLNELMKEYQSYLERGYNKIASSQINYLKQKQNQIIKDLSDVFEEHSKYLQSNIEEMGRYCFLSSNNNAFYSYEQMEEKMTELDLEQAKLNALISQDFCTAILGENLFFRKLAEVTDEIRDLKKRKEPLENYFKARGSPSLEENYFEGIDFQTAISLLVDYNTKIDESEITKKQYAQVQEEIGSPHFVTSSLSSFLSDDLSQSLIVEAGKMHLLLQDEKHHSEKEGQRWKEEISLQKKVLKAHLEQLSKIQDIHTDLHREKLVKLKKAILSSIHQQIAILEEQAKEAISEREEALLKEKEILQSKMAEFRSFAGKAFPEKWRHEQWLSYQEELGIKMMTALTELIESKTMAIRLHHEESKPLDFASLPALPEKSGLFAWTALSCFGSCLAGFCFLILKTLRRGFPASLENIQSLKYPNCGKIDASCLKSFAQENLEPFRRMAGFLEESPSGKVVSLILGEGPDYSYAFTEYLALRSFRSLLIRCDFQTSQESGIGLLQLWKKEIQNISFRSIKSCDVLDTGGVSPFGLEIVQSPFFSDLIEKVRNDYDWIFLCFKSPLKNAESIAGLNFCDKAIVSIAEEPLEQLYAFTHRSCHGKENRLTFVISGRDS